MRQKFSALQPYHFTNSIYKKERNHYITSTTVFTLDTRWNCGTLLLTSKHTSFLFSPLSQVFIFLYLVTHVHFYFSSTFQLAKALPDHWIYLYTLTTQLYGRVSTLSPHSPILTFQYTLKPSSLTFISLLLFFMSSVSWMFSPVFKSISFCHHHHICTTSHMIHIQWPRCSTLIQANENHPYDTWMH